MMYVYWQSTYRIHTIKQGQGTARRQRVPQHRKKGDCILRSVSFMSLDMFIGLFFFSAPPRSSRRMET